MLVTYASNYGDVTVAFHHNLRDPNWSMFSDIKHIHANKIAKYAANIIKSLKKAYNIQSKRELFNSEAPQPLMNQLVNYDRPRFLSSFLPRYKSQADSYHMNQSVQDIRNPATIDSNIYRRSLNTRLQNYAGYDDHNDSIENISNSLTPRYYHRI